MKLLKRNLRDLEYIPYKGESDIDPDTGRHTGEPVPSYDEPIPFEGNLSTPNGYANATFYGEEIRYTHVLLIEPSEIDEPVNEYGLIRDGEDEYEIRAVRPSENVISVALRLRTKNHADGDGA